MNEVRPTADADDLQKTPVTLGVVLKLLVWGGGIMAAVALFFLLRDFSRGEQLSEVRTSIVTVNQQLVRMDKQLETSAERERQTAVKIAELSAKIDQVLQLSRNKP